MFEMGKGSDIFSCQKCGVCCKGYGGTFVTADDVGAISSFLNEDPAVLINKYCRKSGSKSVLTQNKDGYCILWSEQYL